MDRTGNKSEAEGQKTCPWVRRIQVSTNDVRKEVSPLAKIKIKKKEIETKNTERNRLHRKYTKEKNDILYQLIEKLKKKKISKDAMIV